MTLSRAATGLCAVVFATALSVAPGGGETGAPPAAAVREPEAEPTTAPRSTGEAPADLRIEVEAASGRVVARRPGYLVSLRSRGARAGGVDWAAVRVVEAAVPGDGEARGRAGARAAPIELVWETTRLDPAARELDVPPTERGLLSVAPRDGMRLTVSTIEAPEPAGRSRGAHHGCAAQHDGLGGFTVLCRIAPGARRVAAVDVTGPHPLEDVWLAPGPAPLVRLDLPVVSGGAAGRVIGFLDGDRGVLLHVDATFLAGEPPAVTVYATERAQPGAGGPVARRPTPPPDADTAFVRPVSLPSIGQHVRLLGGGLTGSQ